MNSNSTYQREITDTVRSYQKLYPQEMAAFKIGQELQIENNRDKFASVKGTDFILRKLYDVPETLHDMMKVKLSNEAAEYLRGLSGAKWFAKTFKEFRSASVI